MTFSTEDERLLAHALPETRRVEVYSTHFADGHGQLEYREAGAPDNPAILLLHGIGSSSAGYRAQFAGLQDRYRLIAWNAPGYGATTPLADLRPSCSHYVEIVTELLVALGVSRLSGIVGSSWGSVIATAFAARQGASVDALVLSAPNTARRIAQTVEQREQARAAALQAASASFEQSREVIADRLLAPAAAASVRSHALRLRDGVTLAGWEQAINMLFTVFTPELLPTITSRIALIVGADDRVAPEAQHAAVLRAVRPDMNYYRLDGVGHLPKLEAPVGFNAIVDECVRSSGTAGLSRRDSRHV
ncbi:alpha/beta fold hydrolase [Bosea caraganae]|nr:alpha/beta hydrolase [Bosea caraganae]